jgi:hypothetical protein
VAWGKASTYTVVYARLITEGKDYDIHGTKLFPNVMFKLSLPSRLMCIRVPGFICATSKLRGSLSYSWCYHW